MTTSEDLLKKSKKAEHIRETGSDQQEALRESSAIWQEVLFEAEKIGDWERVVDVLGQLALNLKHLRMPALALIPIRQCLSLVEKHFPNNQQLRQVYLAELSNLLGDLGKLDDAQKYGEEAIALAREYDLADLCHVLVQLGKTFLQAKELESAEKYLGEAYQLASDPQAGVRHPAHRAGAMIAYALLQRELGNQQKFEALLKEAEELSRRSNLARRLEQIAEIRRQ